MAKPENPLEILRQLDASEGNRIAQHLRALQMVGRIFTMNAQELRETLTVFNQPSFALQIWADDNSNLFQEYYGEVVRHFHNFLASAGTLADHVMAYIGRLYSGQPFESEYKQKVSELFASSGLAAFVQDLRNYMLHRSLPPTTARLSSEAVSGNVKNAVYLNISALSDWDNWSSRSKAFMATLPPDLDLLEVATPYEDLVRIFYAWLHERLQDLHGPALKELEDLYLQFNLAR